MVFCVKLLEKLRDILSCPWEKLEIFRGVRNEKIYGVFGSFSLKNPRQLKKFFRILDFFGTLPAFLKKLFTCVPKNQPNIPDFLTLMTEKQ